MNIKNKIIKDYDQHKTKIQQLEFLSKSALLEEVAPPFLVKNVTILVILIFVVFISWGTVYNVSELVRATGKVTPSGRVRAIQHLEGGIVKQIHVEEGSFVDVGTPLLTIENKQLFAEKRKLTERKNLLNLQVERALYLSKQNEKTSKSISKKNGDLLNSVSDAFNRERSVIENQLQQKQNELRVLKNREVHAKKSYENSKKAYRHTKSLFKKRIVSRSELLNAEKENINLLSSYSTIKKTQEQVKNSVEEFKNRLKSLDASFKEKNLKEIEEIKHKLIENEQNLNKINDQIKRLNLYSPIKGIINNLKVNTVGGVIIPGSQIMEIVPTSEELIVELNIATEDIGHIELQQEVIIKVTSYDFSRFGSIKGNVVNISPTTYTDESKIPFYKIKVQLEKNYVGDDPNMFHIIPGMLVEGNIKAGKKSVIAYLLKPIHRSISTALSEK